MEGLTSESRSTCELVPNTKNKVEEHATTTIFVSNCEKRKEYMVQVVIAGGAKSLLLVKANQHDTRM